MFSHDPFAFPWAAVSISFQCVLPFARPGFVTEEVLSLCARLYGGAFCNHRLLFANDFQTCLWFVRLLWAWLSGDDIGLSGIAELGTGDECITARPFDGLNKIRVRS